jgi:chitinase
MLKKLTQIIGVVMMLATVYTLPVQASSTHSISGNITLNAVGLKGVTVTIQGTTFSAVTDGLGNYSIHYVPSGTNGTLVPTLANYTFSPKNIAFANLQTTLTGQNFTATQISPIYYSISGKVTKGGVGLAGVLITFATSYTATTDVNGNYHIANVPTATKGRIVPSLAGYAFTPTSITVSSLGANLVNENFTATAVFTVSGKVTDAATLLPLGGVTVTLGSYSAVSSSTTGAYTIRNVPAGTSGTLTPSLTGKTFTPPSVTITNLQANLHSQDFVAAP